MGTQGKKVCMDCRQVAYVNRAQSWRRAQPRCMACGSGRLCSPAEARELGLINDNTKKPQQAAEGVVQ
jgi:hypothetical protein